MKKRIITAAVIVAAIVVVGSVVWKATQHELAPETINIGAVLPLSGPIAFLGEGTLNGLKLAEEDANSGVWGDLSFKINIVAEDCGGVPKNAVGAFQKLRSTRGTKTIITTLSGVCMALKPLAQKEGVLLFANASHPQLTADATTVLRHSNVASQEAEVIVNAMTDGGKVSGVAVVVQNDDYGVAFSKAMEAKLQAASVRVVSTAAYDREGFDARVIAQQAMAKQPGAVILVGVGKDLGLLIRRLRELSFKGDLYASLGFVLVPGAVEAAGEHAAGVNHTRFVLNESDTQYKRVATAYQEKFGSALGAEALIAYNTVYVYCQAAKKAQSQEPRALAGFIREMGSLQAPGENMTITPAGDILPQLQVARFEKP